jgi:phosphate transport system substrate-binding protein
MKSFGFWMSIGLSGLALAGGCRRPAGNSVTLAGSTAFQPFAEKLADQFMAARPEMNITVQGGGSALGIQAALQGTAGIGMADLVNLPPEAAGLTAVTVARDGIAIVVNPANGIQGLTTDQVRGIFSGKIKNWLEAGGADRPIRIISREAGSGTRTSFEQIIGGIDLPREAIVQDSNGTIRETVANDPDSVGYLSHGLLNEKVKALPVDGATCTEEAIINGSSKLVRPVFLLTQGPPTGATQAFLDYILSPEGQETIKLNGLLPAR